MVELVVKDNALYILCVKYIDYLYVVPQTTHVSSVWNFVAVQYCFLHEIPHLISVTTTTAPPLPHATRQGKPVYHPHMPQAPTLPSVDTPLHCSTCTPVIGTLAARDLPKFPETINNTPT